MLQKSDVAQVLAAEGRRTNTRRITTIAVAVLAAAALAGGGWWLWSTYWPTDASTFGTAAATRGDIHVTLTATGTLQPTTEVAVASGTAGTVSSVDVDYNDPVTKGQVLAHLDTTDLESALQRAMAMVDVQSANRAAAATSVSDAAAALRRLEGQRVGVTVTARDLELAQTALERAQSNLLAAQAQLRAAQADLASARNDLTKGIITAPIEGIVLDIKAEVGQSIGASTLGQTLFVVASNLERLDLTIDVDEADVGRVRVGNEATFTVEAAPDEPFSGFVRQVRSAPATSDGVVSYKTLVRIDNRSLMLKPGMTATADIAVADVTDVLVVPSAALRFSPEGSSVGGATVGDGEAVCVLNGDTPTRVAVTTGLTDGTSTEIVAGELEEGDVVLVGGGT